MRLIVLFSAWLGLIMRRASGLLLTGSNLKTYIAYGRAVSVTFKGLPSKRNVYLLAMRDNDEISTGKHNIRLDDSDYNSSAAAGDKAVSLITTAIKSSSKFINSGSPSRNDIISTSANSNLKHMRPTKPLRISFSARHRIRIPLNNTELAQRYLSLPTSEYSVLDSSIVTRATATLSQESNNDDNSRSGAEDKDTAMGMVIDQDKNSEGTTTADDDNNCFIISLPLGDLATTIQTVFSTTGFAGGGGSSMGITTEADQVILRTTIEVLPDVKNGVISMTSGPLFFITESDTLNTSNPSSNVAVSNMDEDDKQMRSFRKQRVGGESPLPSWLVWDERATLTSTSTATAAAVVGNSGSNCATVTQNSSVVTDQQNRQNQPFEQSSNPQSVITSAIQAGFIIELRWKPAKRTEETWHERKENGDIIFDNGRNVNMHTTVLPSTGPGVLEEDEQDRQEEAILLVKADVRSWVKLGMPIRSDVATALNLLPIRVMLSQAGSLIATTAMRQAAPRLSTLLIDDYERWKRFEARNI